MVIDSPQFRYQVKSRPCVREFLEAAHALFELEVYTFGTRPYADAVVAFLDPGGRFFGTRVVSRYRMWGLPCPRRHPPSQRPHPFP
jgi:TFIIF-interacting CTD phosphatase-like protein